MSNRKHYSVNAGRTPEQKILHPRKVLTGGFFNGRKTDNPTNQGAPPRPPRRDPGCPHIRARGADRAALDAPRDSLRVRFEDLGAHRREFVLDRAQAVVKLLVHKGQLGAQRPALCGKLLVNLLRDQLSEFLAELIAVHQHSISWGVSRAHAMPRRVLSLGAGRVLTHESLLRLWQPVAAEPGWFCTWGRFGMQAPHFHSQCRGGL